MRVEVIYARTNREWVRLELELPAGATIGAALQASGLLAEHPEINWAAGFGLAIYGTAADVTHPLSAGDRVEIVRPLVVEPNEARRRRVRKSRPVKRNT
jgi:uncharacterized protein